MFIPCIASDLQTFTVLTDAHFCYYVFQWKQIVSGFSQTQQYKQYMFLYLFLPWQHVLVNWLSSGHLYKG